MISLVGGCLLQLPGPCATLQTIPRVLKVDGCNNGQWHYLVQSAHVEKGLGCPWPRCTWCTEHCSHVRSQELTGRAEGGSKIYEERHSKCWRSVPRKTFSKNASHNRCIAGILSRGRIHVEIPIRHGGRGMSAKQFTQIREFPGQRPLEVQRANPLELWSIRLKYLSQFPMTLDSL